MLTVKVSLSKLHNYKNQAIYYSPIKDKELLFKYMKIENAIILFKHGCISLNLKNNTANEYK